MTDQTKPVTLREKLEAVGYDFEDWPEFIGIIREHAAEVVGGPYPEDIFIPLSVRQQNDISSALFLAPVPHASDRLHAAWARHWAKLLREMQ